MDVQKVNLCVLSDIYIYSGMKLHFINSYAYYICIHYVPTLSIISVSNSLVCICLLSCITIFILIFPLTAISYFCKTRCLPYLPPSKIH